MRLNLAHAKRVVSDILDTPARPTEAEHCATLTRLRTERAADLRARGEELHARCGYARASELFAQADEIDPARSSVR